MKIVRLNSINAYFFKLYVIITNQKEDIMTINKNWRDIIKNTKYIQHPKYNGKDLYPNTGNIMIDWIIFAYNINFLEKTKKESIDEYLYFLDFSKTIAAETGLLERNDIDFTLPQMPIFETENFSLRGNIGAIVPGYTLIIPKSHVLSMSALPKELYGEYIKFLETIRSEYIDIYHQAPIIFEHGSNSDIMPKANSVDHAHTHIINHQYKDESVIINKLNMQEVRSIEEVLELGQNTNYISYISPTGKYYFTDSHPNESQIMRKFIAEDIGETEKWDWKKFPYNENIFETAKQFVLYQQRVGK